MIKTKGVEVERRRRREKERQGEQEFSLLASNLVDPNKSTQVHCSSCAPAQGAAAAAAAASSAL